MPVEPSSPRPTQSDPRAWGATVLPTSPRGWVALGFAAIALASWVVLPVVTSLFREAYPVTDTYAMPAIGLALTVTAAIVNALVVGPGRQRSVLNLVAAALTVGAALFFGVFVIGEGLAGV